MIISERERDTINACVAFKKLHLETPTLTELARQMGKSTSDVTSLTKRLQDKGLIEKVYIKTNAYIKVPNSVFYDLPVDEQENKLKEAIKKAIINTVK